MTKRFSMKLTQMTTFAALALSACGPTAPPTVQDMQVAEFTSIETISDPVTSQSMMDHSHIPVAVPDGIAIPSLSIVVERDWMSGLNLALHTENYALVPPPQGLSMEALMQPSINPETAIAEGHAHLYINGEKVQRIYGNDVHLPDALFKPGLNQITVSINNHGHMYWTTNNRQILATLYVNVDSDDLVVHRFESFPSMKMVDGSICSDSNPLQ